MGKILSEVLGRGEKREMFHHAIPLNSQDTEADFQCQDIYSSLYNLRNREQKRQLTVHFFVP